MRKAVDYIGMGGQWLAVILLFCGIYIEICYMADLGFIAVTCGACCFAVFTKIREQYYKALLHKTKSNNEE